MERRTAIETRARGDGIVSEQRKRFKEWWISELGANKAFDELAEHAAWRAWQVRCPDGWQCVPKEPTREMRDAVINACGSVQVWADARAAWPDMLSAAPKPEDD